MLLTFITFVVCYFCGHYYFGGRLGGWHLRYSAQGHQMGLIRAWLDGLYDDILLNQQAEPEEPGESLLEELERY